MPGERYSGGAMDLARAMTPDPGNARQVFWPVGSQQQAGLDMFERRLELFLRNPIIEGSIVASSFSTAESGRRVEILSDTASRVRFYSGKAAETSNGAVDSFDSGGREIARFIVSELGNPGPVVGTYRATILLYARDDSFASLIQATADSYQFLSAGNFEISGGPLVLQTTGVRVPDGTTAAPSMSFNSSVTTGFYRLASTIRWSIGNNTGGYLFNGGLRVDNGTAAAPSLSFSGFTNYGLFATTNLVATSVAGVERWRVTNVNTQSFVRFYEISQTDQGVTLRDSATSLETINKYVGFESSQGTRRGLVGHFGGHLYLWNDGPTFSTILRANSINGIRLYPDGQLDLGVASSTNIVNLYGVNVRIPNITTGGGGNINCQINPTNNEFRLQSSSLKHKNIDRYVTPAEARELLYSSAVFFYRDKRDGPDGLLQVGMGAETVHENGGLDAEVLVRYIDDEPAGLGYDVMGPLLAVVVRDQQKQIDELKSMISGLVS